MFVFVRKINEINNRAHSLLVRQPAKVLALVRWRWNAGSIPAGPLHHLKVYYPHGTINGQRVECKNRSGL